MEPAKHFSSLGILNDMVVHLHITVMAMPMPIISPITTSAVVGSTLPVLEGGAEAHQDEL